MNEEIKELIEITLQRFNEVNKFLIDNEKAHLYCSNREELESEMKRITDRVIDDYHFVVKNQIKINELLGKEPPDITSRFSPLNVSRVCSLICHPFLNKLTYIGDTISLKNGVIAFRDVSHYRYN